jgi:ABC-type lipopolysaccharide export system ATPase subunit
MLRSLLDEPYNGLSPLMIEKINLLLRQDAQHKGIIITDHNYENVIAIAKIILMKDGKAHHLVAKKGVNRHGLFKARHVLTFLKNDTNPSITVLDFRYVTYDHQEK